MKKMLLIFIALCISFLSLQIVVTVFVSYHSFDYSVITDGNGFDITEVYKRSKKPRYDFIVKDKEGHSFIFSDYNDYNRQKRVIKDIAYYAKDEIYCIMPVYRRNHIGEITCNYKDSITDFSYLSSVGIDTKPIVEVMYKYNYVNDNVDDKSVADTETLTNGKVFTIYKNNLLKDYIFPIWNYNGLYLIYEDKQESKVFYNEDMYDNTNSTLFGKYYFIFPFNNGYTSEFDFVNIENGGKQTFLFPETISDNMYVNGTYKKKLYVADPKSDIQYSINVFSEQVEMVGNKEKGFVIVKDGKLVTVPYNEFYKEKYNFNKITNDDIKKKYGDLDLYEYDDFYYFKSKDDVFYKVNKNYLPYPIKLFQMKGVSDYKIVNGDIMAVKGDTMYLYTEAYGLRSIVSNNEFIYNYKNICNFYKKS